MLRTPPMNYLASGGLLAVLWVLTGLFLGNYLGDTVSLQEMTVERFLLLYRVTTGVASLVALLICYYWYARGANKAAAADPAGHRRLWVGLMITQVVVAAAALVALVVAMLSEALTVTDYVLMFGALLVDTGLVFWLCTLAMSPRPVMAVVPGKR